MPQQRGLAHPPATIQQNQLSRPWPRAGLHIAQERKLCTTIHEGHNHLKRYIETLL
jgi:hypothetical protein